MIAPHCVDEFGDSTCQFRFPTKPYCDKYRPASDDQGCAAQPPQTPACIPDDPGMTTFTTTGGGTDPSSGSTTEVDSLGTSSISASISDTDPSSGSSGGPFICATADGAFDEECEALDSTRPYCVSGECTNCSDAGGNAFCFEGSDLTPSCNIETGQCVSCLDAPETFSCDPGTPVCDETGACRQCTSHAECPDTACHLDPSDIRFGRCFELDERVWVDNTSICPGAGTEASPNCSLESAVSTVPASGNVVILVQGTGSPYEDNPVLTADATVSIRGIGGPRITGLPADADPTLEILAGTVYIDGLRLNDNGDDHGMTCSDGATVWLQNSEVAGNDFYGVYGNPGA